MDKVLTSQFLFLYPIPEIINFEIESNGWMENGGLDVYKKKYAHVLNSCIDARYRQNGYMINYAVFSGTRTSDVIALRETDKIIEVGLDFKTHITKQPDGTYLYPDPTYILSQLGKIDKLRVAGFHMWDCVEKVAKAAYIQGLDVLVDEDLTEFLPGRMKDADFKIDTYPTYDPIRRGEDHFKFFMGARSNCPWLWQEY